jgi:hypothetical protein
LIIHLMPLKVDISKLYQNISYFNKPLLLTLKLHLVYNSFDKVAFRNLLRQEKGSQ